MVPPYRVDSTHPLTENTRSTDLQHLPVVACFGSGGRQRPHALLHERRKHLHKRFSSTHSPQADGCPEGPVSCSLAVIGCLSICWRAWRCWGSSRLRQLFNLYIGIPSLEHSAQFAVERLDACLQQQMCAPFAPLHLLFFAEAFAHDLVHGRLYKPRGYGLATPIPLALIRDQVRIVHDICAELFHGFE